MDGWMDGWMTGLVGQMIGQSVCPLRVRACKHAEPPPPSTDTSQQHPNTPPPTQPTQHNTTQQGFVLSGNWPTWVIETLHEAPARVTVTSIAYNLGTCFSSLCILVPLSFLGEQACNPNPNIH
jgi:hypothetical protein